MNKFLCGWILGVLLFAFVLVLHNPPIFAQSAAERPFNDPVTKQWSIAVESHPQYSEQYVQVIDTAGVCIYLYRDASGEGRGITTVPKTQLKPGAGCQ